MTDIFNLKGLDMSHSLTHPLTLLAFVAFSFIAIASPDEDRCVKFPSKEVLIKSLRENGYAHIENRTNLADIVNHKLNPMGVVLYLECVLFDYNKRTAAEELNNPELVRMMAIAVQKNKRKILEILLQNDPDALYDIKSSTMYKLL